MTIDSCTLESHPLESRFSASTPISGRPLDDRSPQAAVLLALRAQAGDLGALERLLAAVPEYRKGATLGDD